LSANYGPRVCPGTKKFVIPNLLAAGKLVSESKSLEFDSKRDTEINSG
jgi:hypothetical protein